MSAIPSAPGPASASERRPLVIALINNLYPPYIVGGNEILARDVSEALRRRGHTVHILTGRGRDLPNDGFTHAALDVDLDRKEDLFLGGLPLTAARVIRWHLYNGASRRGVANTLRSLHPDLVIAWNLYMASAAPLIGARAIAAPRIAHPADKWLLYSLDDIGRLVPATSTLQRLFVGGLRTVVQPVLKWFARPDYILTVSDFIRRLHLDAGYPAAQTLSTHLGVHTERFEPSTHPFPGERPWRLLYAGQLWAGKGPQVAVRAVEILRQRADLPPVELDIYGGGAENFRTWLGDQIGAADLTQNVKLRGFTPQPELAQAFQDHDLFLFTSIWDEPFSGGLLEAMGSGLPTIATTAGGTPEAVQDGRNGLLVPPDDPQALADAIARLMRDPELYVRLGRGGADSVQERWTFERYIDRLEAAYYAIVDGHRRGAPVDLSLPPTASTSAP